MTSGFDGDLRFPGYARAEQTLARPDAIALLDKATHYSARKYVVVARTLLARIAMISGAVDVAAEHINATKYPAPLRAWQAYSVLGQIEMRRGNPDAAIAAYGRAASIIRYVSDHISDNRLRRIFLSLDAIRAILAPHKPASKSRSVPCLKSKPPTLQIG